MQRRAVRVPGTGPAPHRLAEHPADHRREVHLPVPDHHRAPGHLPALRHQARLRPAQEADLGGSGVAPVSDADRPAGAGRGVPVGGPAAGGPQRPTPDLHDLAELQHPGHLLLLLRCGVPGAPRPAPPRATPSKAAATKSAARTAASGPASQRIGGGGGGRPGRAGGVGDRPRRPVAGAGRCRRRTGPAAADRREPAASQRRPHPWDGSARCATTGPGGAGSGDPTPPEARRWSAEVLLDLGQLVGGEVEVVQRGDVRLQLLDAARPDDQAGHPRVTQRPGQRELGQRLAAPLGDRAEGTDRGHLLVGRGRSR